MERNKSPTADMQPWGICVLWGDVLSHIELASVDDINAWL